MFEAWENFYLIVGPSAGALIGLMFVVVTLSEGRNRAQFEIGKHLYTSPVVFHLGVVLVLSGAAVAPTMRPSVFGCSALLLSICGAFFGTRSAIGIRKVRLVSASDSIFDMWWYGIVPTLSYVCLAAAALALLAGNSWGESAIAAALMALLLVSIHAEWDLVTFLAPRADSDKS